MESVHYRNIASVETSNWWYRGKREILLSIVKRLALLAKATVLDVGCGTGMVISRLQSETDLRCYGLEPDKGFYRLADFRLPGQIVNLTLDEFVRSIAAKRSTLPGKYDLITCIDTLEHLKDDKLAVAQMAALLKPDGILLLYCPAYNFLWGRLDAISHHYRRYTRCSLEELTKQAGLSSALTSYSNMILFLPIALIRILSRFASRDLFFDPTGLKPHHPFINWLFYHLYTLEKYFFRWRVSLVKRKGLRTLRQDMITLPFGVSVFIVASKSSIKI